jgi:hypothetical protein
VKPEPTPVLSRRTISSTMAARGLRSAAELAKGKPCGTRVRYYGGCRCDACRAANTAYERERAAARARGESGRIVSAERARSHLAMLRKQGIGYKTAADAAKVAPSIVAKIVYGERTKIRAQTEARILAVTEAAAADRAYIDGTETLRRIGELLAWGYTKTRIASEVLGRPARSLQIKPGRVTVRNAERVRRVHERLRYVPAAPTLQRLQELSEEGFHRNKVAQRLAELAARRGWDVPDLAVRNGLVRHQAAELVAQLHGQLIEQEEDACAH